jgi:hypothetical protein
MSDYKFDYNIANEHSHEIFEHTCRLIENIDGVEKGEYVADEDGSEMQFFRRGGEKAAVHSSAFLEVVYVTSEFSLDPWLL